MTNTIGATPEERELIERIARLIEQQRNQRGDYLSCGEPDAELIDAKALLESLISNRAKLREAASNVLERMGSTFKARNGRDVGIQGDDGEKIWLVHSDDIEALRAARMGLARVPQERRALQRDSR